MGTLRDFQRGFLGGFRLFGLSISSALNAMMLLIVYVTGIGIASLLGKAKGKRFLDKGISSSGSYWKEIPNEEGREYRQF